jgi:hypothetical protein
VTVIFLPLSTVAGIFGMNTNDIRNLDSDQWLYWAVAAPITVVVIILGLIWAGELGNFLAGVLDFWSSETKTAHERKFRHRIRARQGILGRGYFDTEVDALAKIRFEEKMREEGRLAWNAPERRGERSLRAEYADSDDYRSRSRSRARGHGGYNDPDSRAARYSRRDTEFIERELG